MGRSCKPSKPVSRHMRPLTLLHNAQRAHKAQISRTEDRTPAAVSQDCSATEPDFIPCTLARKAQITEEISHCTKRIEELC